MKKLILLSILAMASISCTEDDVRPDHQFNSSAKVVGFEKTTQAISYFSNQGQVTINLPLNVLGGGDGMVFAQDVKVGYTVSFPANTADLTPAVENDEFNFADNSGFITIPAGRSFGEYPILVNTGNLDPTEATEMYVNLTSVNGAVISEAHKQLRIVFIGCQSLVKTGSGPAYTVTVTSSTGVVRVYTGEVVTSPSVNNFRTRTTGTWSFGQIASGSSGQGYDFSDICGDITLAKDQTLFRYYSNTVKGTGFYGGVDGQVLSLNSFRTRYEISFAAGNTEYLAVYVR